MNTNDIFDNYDIIQKDTRVSTKHKLVKQTS